jgi:hypothetical protein
MPDFITLTCPSCGGKLKVTDQIHLLACRNCGNEHMVVRDSGTLYLAPIAQDVRHIRVGVDKTAAELAVARLTREIDALELQTKALTTRPDEEWVAGGKWIKALAFLGVLLLFAVWAAPNGDNPRAFVIAGIVLLGLAFALHLYRSEKINRLRSTKIGHISAELGTKYEQYRKNRKIAES